MFRCDICSWRLVYSYGLMSYLDIILFPMAIIIYYLQGPGVSYTITPCAVSLVKRWVCINIVQFSVFFHRMDYLKEFISINAVYGRAKLREFLSLYAFYECEPLTWTPVKS